MFARTIAASRWLQVRSAQACAASLALAALGCDSPAAVDGGGTLDAGPGDTGAPVDALVAIGWPGERVLVEAAATRVRVAIATLRRHGLRQVLLTRDDGYLIDPAVRLEWS